MTDSKPSDAAAPPPAKKPFEFKKSALSAKADQMWSQSKLGFSSGAAPTHIKLEKKTLDDVLGKMAATKKEQEDRQNKPKFIFGSKIADRVVRDESSSDEKVAKNGDGDAPKKAEDLFKSAAQNKSDAVPAKTEDFRAEAVAAAEKMKEQEKQHASTSIVEVHTGEEGDEVVFQNACKLHSYDKERKSWVEKGLSHIRINKRVDNGEVQYRIVARTTGNHRVVINSNFFADMLLERVDQKRIKLSAMGPDSPAMQIFLVTIGFSKTDLTVDQFYETLCSVLEKEKLAHGSKRKRKAEDEAAEGETKKEKPNDFAEYDGPVNDTFGKVAPESANTEEKAESAESQ